MTLRPAKTLVRLISGSRLYGCNVATSDTDYFSVYLPSGRDILLQKPDRIINNSTKTNSRRKNTPSDVDDQAISLKKFFCNITNGNLHEIEALYAPSKFILTATPEWSYLVENRDKLASMYFVKTMIKCGKAIFRKCATAYSGLNDLNYLLKSLEDEHIDDSLHLYNIKGKLEIFVKDLLNITLFHCKEDGDDSLEILSKIYSTDITISYLKTILRDERKKFERILCLEKIENYKKVEIYKDMYHAVRLVDQTQEMIKTNKLSFENGHVLKDVRANGTDLKRLKTRIFYTEQALKKPSGMSLRQTPDVEFIESCLIEFNRGQIQP